MVQAEPARRVLALFHNPPPNEPLRFLVDYRSRYSPPPFHLCTPSSFPFSRDSSSRSDSSSSLAPSVLSLQGVSFSVSYCCYLQHCRATQLQSTDLQPSSSPPSSLPLINHAASNSFPSPSPRQQTATAMADFVKLSIFGTVFEVTTCVLLLCYSRGRGMGGRR